jgi:hypothetical protein
MVEISDQFIECFPQLLATEASGDADSVFGNIPYTNLTKSDTSNVESRSSRLTVAPPSLFLGPIEQSYNYELSDLVSSERCCVSPHLSLTSIEELGYACLGDGAGGYERDSQSCTLP